MTRILLTAFEPYDHWSTNASWLALVELTRELPTDAEITTRLYPVELDAMKDKLAVDLKASYDFVFHVGQAPKSSCIFLEEIALNVVTTGKTIKQVENGGPVYRGGPDAHRSSLPLRAYARALRDAGIPARVSCHAGSYLCNATLYWSLQLIEDLELPTKAAFVHVPLATSQVLELDDSLPFMPSSMAADALSLLVKLAAHKVPQPQT